MLSSLTIENYALIDKLDLSFEDGFSIITGETGAGKSILLGALSLVLGSRADTGVLKSKEENCVVEVTFRIDGYNMQPLFESYDIDYNSSLTIRRIITNAGKSRAFINDFPVNLNVLKDFGDKLLDIHSQHQNLLLSSTSFQLSVLDSMAKIDKELSEYSKTYKAYKLAVKKKEELEQTNEKAKKDYDYTKFQYNQLQDATLANKDEPQELEEELKKLSNIEKLQETYMQVNSMLSANENNSVVYMLKESVYSLGKLKSIDNSASELEKRLDSAFIEVKDIASEIESVSESLTMDPERLEYVENRISLIFELLQKHKASNIEELISIKNGFEENLLKLDNFDFEIKELEKEVQIHLINLEKQAKYISEQRIKAAPEIEQYVINILQNLGMPNTLFKVDIKQTKEYTAIGRDEVSFLFSANKDMPIQEISKVASGGEMSRLMLALKSLLVQNVKLPTIIFDEIDTGISGEVADKMGTIIKKLSANTQIINITHLPQIAAKGKHHYVVYKEDTALATFTRVKKLTPEQRVLEIAKMLSGSSVTEAAIQNATELLKNN